MNGRILVLGEDNRSCLAIVRSLGRQGLDVWLGAETPDSIVRHSRYVRRTVQMPSTNFHVDAWLAQLHALLEREPFDVVIPCSDNTLVPLVRHRAMFEPLSRLAVPDDQGFEYSYSKSKTLALAERLRVPVPRTIPVESQSDLAEIRSNRDLPFPLIVKPVSSKIWKDGKRFDLRVRRAPDWSSLESIVNGMLDVTPVLVQTYFQGIGVGQEFLAHEGRILDAFQHERVHEPLSGGGSSYRKSVPANEEMLDCSRRLLSHLRWTGVAMVEYKQNPATGDFVLMEINGRFWGSLPLAVAAGIDFPYHLYQLLMKQPVNGCSTYESNVHCRNLAKDAAWFRERLRGTADGSFGFGSLVAEVSTGLRNLLSGRERIDTITLDDPIPGLAEIWDGLTARGRKLGRKAMGRAEGAVLGFRASREMWRRRQRGKLRSLLDADPRLLFVCRGNICRSPFAEAYAALRSGLPGSRSFEIRSAGTLPVEGRQPPAEARLVSREFGVSLDAHRSRALERSLVGWAGAVVCMDSRNYEELRAKFPEVRRKLLYLGAFDPADRQVPIADPWNKPAEDFRSCYREIVSSVDGLLDALRS